MWVNGDINVFVQARLLAKVLGLLADGFQATPSNATGAQHSAKKCKTPTTMSVHSCMFMWFVLFRFALLFVLYVLCCFVLPCVAFFALMSPVVPGAALFCFAPCYVFSLLAWTVS